MGQFSAGSINKAVPEFYQQFDNSKWTVMENILSIYLCSDKCLHLTAFELSWIVETIVDNVSPAKLQW